MSQIYPEIQQATAPGYGQLPDQDTMRKMSELQDRAMKTG